MRGRQGASDLCFLPPQLLEGAHKERIQSVANLSSRTEHLKRRATVHREVQKLLLGHASEGSFHDTVDALDQKTRGDMLDEIAVEIKVLGTFLRVQYAMQAMSQSLLDMTSCCQLYIREVKKLIKGKFSRVSLRACACVCMRISLSVPCHTTHSHSRVRACAQKCECVFA